MSKIEIDTEDYIRIMIGITPDVLNSDPRIKPLLKIIVDLVQRNRDMELALNKDKKYNHERLIYVIDEFRESMNNKSSINRQDCFEFIDKLRWAEYE